MERVRIVSYSDESFKDRREAGGFLGLQLQEYRGLKAVVLGIPRGGIVVASEIVRLIEGELDVMLTRKIGFPGNPELAIGAIAEDGKLFLNEILQSGVSVESKYIQQEKERQLVEIARRTALYRKVRPKVSLRERLVIITDDGLATGSTMQVAIWAVCQENPEKLIVAVPVAPEETLRKLVKDTDEIICLRCPHFFASVGQFYMRFDQIEDEEVLASLKEYYEGGDNTK